MLKKELRLSDNLLGAVGERCGKDHGLVVTRYRGCVYPADMEPSGIGVLGYALGEPVGTSVRGSDIGYSAEIFARERKFLLAPQGHNQEHRCRMAPCRLDKYNHDTA